MKHITFLEKKEITESFQEDVLEIELMWRGITRIIKIDPFLNLTHLSFSVNKISKIEGLDNLVNLQELDLSVNQITKIEGFDNLVNLQKLYLSYNQITKIESINHLVNLNELRLLQNQITKIEGLDKLVNLHELILSENQITQIEGLDKLVNLQYLGLSYNQINKIERLGQLVNLQTLTIQYNQITKIEGINNLINLQNFYIHQNPIIEMNDPSQITPCINLIVLVRNDNTIIHPVIIRFLNRNKLKNDKMHIFNDSQNVHNSSINRNIIESVNRLMKDIPLKEVNQTELLNDHILTEKTKRLLLEYMDYPEQHSLLLLSFSELFGIIWQVIQKHPDASTIKEVLNQEMNDSICKCFTGRMNRLVNVLNGFDLRVIIKIDDSDAIANVIIMLQKKYTNITELKEAVYKELIDREYEETVIKYWIDFIE